MKHSSRRDLTRLAGAAILASAIIPTVTSAQTSVASQTAQPDWLSQILAHHRQLEKAFEAVKATKSAGERTAAQENLAKILTAHAFAEETSIYPAMAMGGTKADADSAYKEQDQVKIDMAALDAIPDKMSPPYLSKLDAIQKAVAEHMKHEESQWYPALAKSTDANMNKKMSEHYRRDFARFIS